MPLWASEPNTVTRPGAGPLPLVANGWFGTRIAPDGTWQGQPLLVTGAWGSRAPESLESVTTGLQFRILVDGRPTAPDPARPYAQQAAGGFWCQTAWTAAEGHVVIVRQVTEPGSRSLTAEVSVWSRSLVDLQIEAGTGTLRPDWEPRLTVTQRSGSGPPDKSVAPPPGVTFVSRSVELRLDGAAPSAEPTRAWITIEGPPEDGRAVSSFLSTLLVSVPRLEGEPVSPFGLSHTRYGGRQFWDADAWIFPALAFLEPRLARAVPAHRARTLAQARRNFDAWFTGGRRLRIGQVESPVTATPGPGLMFPWESAKRGDEQAPGEARYQHHVTGTAAFWFDKAAALGLAEDQVADEVLQGAGHFYLARLSRLPDGRIGVLNTMSPDEFKVDARNDLYTNVVAEWCVRRAGLALPGEVKRPGDGRGYTTFDDDPGKGYKQAAALLAVWPLQDPGAERQAAVLLERFAGKSTPNGPAMSHAIDATVRARFGDPDVALQEWRRAWQPYTANPFLLFSEARNGKNTYFATGAAGALNTVLYGFLGLRIDRVEPVGAPWKVKLRRGYWLSARPRLPSEWKRVTVEGLEVLGERYRLTASGTQIRVERLGP